MKRIVFGGLLVFVITLQHTYSCEIDGCQNNGICAKKESDEDFKCFCAYEYGGDNCGIIASYKHTLPHLYYRGTSNYWGNTVMVSVGDYLWQFYVVNATASMQFRLDKYGNWSESYGLKNYGSHYDGYDNLQQHYELPLKLLSNQSFLAHDDDNNFAHSIHFPEKFDCCSILFNETSELLTVSSCTQSSMDKMYIRGWNDQLLLANTTTTTTTTTISPSFPNSTTNANTYVGVSSGSTHSCAWKSNGLSFCWGENYQGETGVGWLSKNGTEVTSPTIVEGLKDTQVKQIAVGRSYSCALSYKNKVLCWGSSHFIEEKPTYYFDTLVSDIEVTQIAAGFDHTCALTSNNTVMCFGANHSGQLGIQKFSSYETVPQVIANFTSDIGEIDHIACGGETSCALTISGRVYCWGRITYSESNVGPGGGSNGGDSNGGPGGGSNGGDSNGGPGGGSNGGDSNGGPGGGSNGGDSNGGPGGGSNGGPGGGSNGGDSNGGPGGGSNGGDSNGGPGGGSNGGPGGGSNGGPGGGSNGGDRRILSASTPPVSQDSDATHNSAFPVEIDLSVLATDKVTRITLGQDHIVMLTASGNVFCLGSNSRGQLGGKRIVENTSGEEEIGFGSGSQWLRSSNEPVLLALPAHLETEIVVGVTAGSGFSFAWTASSKVIMWGIQNDMDAQSNYGRPRRILNDRNPDILSMDAGESHGCLVSSFNGEVYCFGKNSGRLGSGSIYPESSISLILANTDWKGPISRFIDALRTINGEGWSSGLEVSDVDYHSTYSNETMTYIAFSSYNLSGVLQQYLDPINQLAVIEIPSLESLDLSNNIISGRVNFEYLPSQGLTLDLQNNQLYGLVIWNPFGTLAYTRTNLDNNYIWCFPASSSYNAKLQYFGIQCIDLPCPAGSLGHYGVSNCAPCPRGYHCSFSGTDFSTIQLCSDGASCPTSSIVESRCPAGFFCTNPSVLVQCPAGFYCPTESVTPLSCGVGTYRDKLGGQDTDACSKCPEHMTTTAVGAKSISSCVCIEGFFSIAKNTNIIVNDNNNHNINNTSTTTSSNSIEVTDPVALIQCSPCYGSAKCLGLGNTLQSVIARNGYWRKSYSQPQILPCPYGKLACVGPAITLDPVTDEVLLISRGESFALKSLNISQESFTSSSSLTSNNVTNSSGISISAVSFSFQSLQSEFFEGDDYCTDGHTGFVCSTCVPGFYRRVTLENDSPCIQCQEYLHTFLFQIAIFVFIISFFTSYIVYSSIRRGRQYAECQELLEAVKSGRVSLAEASATEKRSKLRKNKFTRSLTVFRRMSAPTSIQDLHRFERNYKRVVLQRLIISHLQVLGLIGNFNLLWPSQVLPLFDITNALFNMSYLSNGIGGFHCLSQRLISIQIPSPVMNILLSTLFLLLYLTVVVFYWKVIYQGCCHRKEKLKSKDVNQKVIISVVALCYMIYSSLARIGFSLFSCTIYPGENLSRLDNSLDNLCYQGQHLLYTFVLGIPYLVLVVGGLPYLAWNRIYVFSGVLNDSRLIEKYGILYKGYKDGFWFWECIVLTRKLALAALGVFLNGSENSYIQSLTAVFVLGSALIIQLLFAPYDDKGLNRLEWTGLVTGCITIYAGLWSFEINAVLSPWIKILASVAIYSVNILWLLSIIHFFLVSEKQARTKVDPMDPIMLPEVLDNDHIPSEISMNDGSTRESRSNAPLLMNKSAPLRKSKLGTVVEPQDK